jgi:hypothetical protein
MRILQFGFVITLAIGASCGGGGGEVTLDCGAYCNRLACLYGTDRTTCMTSYCPCADESLDDDWETCINKCGKGDTCDGVEACTCEPDVSAKEDAIRDDCVDRAFRCSSSADNCPTEAAGMAIYDDELIERLVECYTIPCNASLSACKDAAMPPECK